MENQSMPVPTQALRRKHCIDPLQPEAFLPILIPKSPSFYADKAAYCQETGLDCLMPYGAVNLTTTKTYNFEVATT